jgi:hypothetical protein
MRIATKPEQITGDVAARLLMLSPARVYQLTRDGWIPRPITVAGAVQGYVKFLNDERRRANRKDIDGTVQRERARKFKISNDLSESSLVEVADVVAMIDEISGLVKAELSAFSARAADDVTLRRKLEAGVDKVLVGIARRSQQAVGDICAGRDVASGADDAESSATVLRLPCPLCP